MKHERRRVAVAEETEGHRNGGPCVTSRDVFGAAGLSQSLKESRSPLRWLEFVRLRQRHLPISKPVDYTELKALMKTLPKSAYDVLQNARRPPKLKSYLGKWGSSFPCSTASYASTL